MGGYAEGEPDEAARLRGEATDREIMRQAIEGLRETQERFGKTLEAMRHEKPPPNGHISRGQIVNLALGALLTAALGFAGVSYWRSTDRLDRIEETARGAAGKVEQIVKDDVGRKAYVDARLAELDRRVAPVEIIARDVARLEKTTENFDLRLTAGREERLAENARIVDAVNASKTELALLRQEMQQTRSLIEGQRAPPPFRRPSMLRFDLPRIMFASAQYEAPFMVAQLEPAGAEIAASIEEDRSEIARMRGWLRSMRETIAANVGRRPEPEFEGDDDDAEPPDALPAPRRARPEVREVEPRVGRKAEPSRRTAKKRRWRGRALAAGSFTRALERAFGRPYYRMPYWLSLNARARRGR